MAAAASASDSRAKRRIQHKKFVAIHAQNKHQLVSKNCVETDDRLRCSLIQSVHFTLYSTHSLCIHMGLGANQNFRHWQMTIVRSPNEWTAALNRSLLEQALAKQLYSYGMTPHSIHNFTIATTKCSWNHVFYHRSASTLYHSSHCSYNLKRSYSVIACHVTTDNLLKHNATEAA